MHLKKLQQFKSNAKKRCIHTIYEEESSGKKIHKYILLNSNYVLFFVGPIFLRYFFDMLKIAKFLLETFTRDVLKV